MDESNIGQAMQERAGRRWLVGTIAGFVGILIISLALACMPGRHRHGWRHGELTPERIEEVKGHAEFGLGRVLGKIDADEAQEERILEIAFQAIDRAVPLIVGHKSPRRLLGEALLGDAIDRDALEVVRQREIQRADELSLLLLNALADAAEVLTAEQRAELAQHVGRHHRM